MNTPNYYADALIKHAFAMGTPLRYIGKSLGKLLGGRGTRAGYRARALGHQAGNKADAVQAALGRYGHQLGKDFNNMSNAGRLTAGGLMALPAITGVSGYNTGARDARRDLSAEDIRNYFQRQATSTIGQF
jgi:hypothetical protein